MKVDFALPVDHKEHRFCIDCRAENVDRVHAAGKTMYRCNVCGHTNMRAIYFNKHKFWTDKAKELWHESCGIFVRNDEGEYLFFERTEYPFLLTVPSGHVDKGESPEAAAMRELAEEVGIQNMALRYMTTVDINGDSCSAGADSHRWSAYFLQLKGRPRIAVKDEGKSPVWLTIKKAQSLGLIFSVDYIYKNYRNKLAELA